METVDTIELMERAMQQFRADDLTGAEQLCQQVLQEEIDNPDAHYLLGVIEHKRGNHEKAEQLINAAIKTEGRAFWYYAMLAEVRSARGNGRGAVDALKAAIQAQPDQPPLYDALAKLLLRLGQMEEHAETWKALAQLLPNNPTVLNNLGAALLMVMRSHEAIDAYRRAVELKPDSIEALAGLAVALADDHQPEAAFETAQKATALAPDDAYTHYTNGVVLAAHKQNDRAVEAFEQAVAKDPNHVEARRRLAHEIAQMGELETAMEHWQAVTNIMPAQPTVRHHMLFTYNYLPDSSLQDVFEAHTQWAKTFADPWMRYVAPHSNTPEPNRKLRVGYLSADLRYHAVAMFFRPILQNHDDQNFHTVCFSSSRKPDEMARALQDMSDGWHAIRGKPPQEVADLIRHEGIDILVDLGGHTRPELVPVLSLKPAPVQCSYLGYCNTTGMQAMDYVFGDDITDPPEKTQPYVEQLIRLPGCFCCYGPVQSAPDVNELPALSRGYVTLASYNALQKINGRVLDLWARLLGELPNTKLLFYRHRLTERAQSRLRRELQQRGVDDDRILMRRDIDKDDKMKLRVFHEADIGIDAFPWTGHTTCCNAMWMGMPYVTLRWPSHAGRMAASAITHAGFPEWVAETEDDYVRIVRSLVDDLPRLAELRRSIRPKMAASTLCDAASFTRNWEAALRSMWRTWCIKRRQMMVTEESVEATRGLR